MKLTLPCMFIILCMMAHHNLSAQLKHCGTDEAVKQLFEAHPEMLQSFIDNERSYDLGTTTHMGVQSVTVYTIPVVFHILHENGPENISDAQIFDAMTVLNRDMRKLNADTIGITPKFKGLASDIRIEFVLARLDPQGNCTNGIDRIYTSRTNYGDDSAKVNPWPRDRYLNIWTAKAVRQGWAGYAYYPSAATGSLSVRDGIMVLADYVGSIGTSDAFKSRTLTHEVGHWLDLGHPWNTTINIAINVGLACGDDLISDTPITKGHVTCPDPLTPDCRIDPFSTDVFNFNGVTTSSGASDPSALSTTFDILTVTPFQAVGVSANSSGAGSFSFSDWPVGAANGETNYSALTGTINTTKYYEITIAPKPSSSMSLSGLKFLVGRSATGPRTYAIRSSADGFTANLTATITPANANLSVHTGNVFFYKTDATAMEAGSAITVSGASFTHKDTPVTFRIYAWNAEDNLGSFTIDDVSILGSTGVIENIQNYMEYSYCTFMFTRGQKDRMRLAIESPVSGRSNLWSTTNLIATGVAGPTTTCVPMPDFYTTRTRICKGNSLTFTKNIKNAVETSLIWTFQGGIPASSTSANPSVTYPAAGVYSVSLSAVNAAGSATVTKTQYIRVDDTQADVIFSGSYSEGFETPSILDYTWQSYNYDGNAYKWSFAANAGTGGTHAARMNAYGNYAQDIDELMSPSYDLTNAQNKSFSFKVAAASTTTSAAAIKDELKVFYSFNCGSSWIQRAVYTGTALINNPASASAFVPGASTVWTQHSISIPPFFQTNNLRVKFQYKSSFVSNNVYIDDVNISETVGLNEKEKNGSSISIYPNPGNETTTVSYHLNGDAMTSLTVMDIMGKVIYATPSVKQEAGDYRISLTKREQNLSNGVYFVRLIVNNRMQTEKLIISE